MPARMLTGMRWLALLATLLMAPITWAAGFDVISASTRLEGGVYRLNAQIQYRFSEAAREALVEGWDAVRRESPGASQVMLAHTRADVAELNQRARARMRDAGALGADQVVQTERGARSFAAGDRVMFLRNERSMGVKNGSLGTVQRIEPHGGGSASLTVRLDGADRRQVQFDLKDYAQIDHGYASTIHKSQGVTVDHGHLLASDGLDRHAAYVGMSRHRETLAVHYGADDFKGRDQLTRTLGRERAKDTTLDYPRQYDRTFAERRGIEPAVPIGSEIVVERPGPGSSDRRAFANFKLRPGPERGTFANFKPRAPAAATERAAPKPIQLDRPGREALVRGVRDYTRAFEDVVRMHDKRLPVLPHQDAALKRAAQDLAKISPEGARDLHTALSRNPDLARGVERPGGLDQALKAMSYEGRVRADPSLRADRFVGDWKTLSAQRDALKGWEHTETRKAVESRMKTMAQGLGRDAEVYALLDGRRRDLGLAIGSGLERGRNLTTELTRTLSRGLGLSR